MNHLRFLHSVHHQLPLVSQATSLLRSHPLSLREFRRLCPAMSLHLCLPQCRLPRRHRARLESPLANQRINPLQFHHPHRPVNLRRFPLRAHLASLRRPQVASRLQVPLVCHHHIPHPSLRHSQVLNRHVTQAANRQEILRLNLRELHLQVLRSNLRVNPLLSLQDVLQACHQACQLLFLQGNLAVSLPVTLPLLLPASLVLDPLLAPLLAPHLAPHLSQALHPRINHPVNHQPIPLRSPLPCHHVSRPAFHPVDLRNVPLPGLAFNQADNQALNQPNSRRRNRQLNHPTSQAACPLRSPRPILLDIQLLSHLGFLRLSLACSLRRLPLVNRLLPLLQFHRLVHHQRLPASQHRFPAVLRRINRHRSPHVTHLLSRQVSHPFSRRRSLQDSRL